MKNKILLIIKCIIISNISLAQYGISIGEYDINNKTVEIILENEEAIGGFQFQITGLDLIGASGGTAEDVNYSVSTSEIGIVLGFSYSGAIIPAGISTLTNLSFESINNQFTEIINITLSSPNGVTISNTTTSGSINHGPPFCDGNWDSYADIDECGICNGLGSIYDCGCSDIVDGFCDCNNNILDDCSVCGGNNSTCYFYLELANFNIDEQTVDVIISNPQPILGFQFSITGLNILSASGGLAENNGFTTNVGSGVILGFSWSGSNIPISNNEILTTISFDSITDSSSLIENIILSDLNTNTITNIESLGLVNHGESNCAGNYYDFDDTNIYGCCFDDITDCLGECNGASLIDECGVCNGNGYSCLDCFEFGDLECTASPFCDWETESIDCSTFSYSSQCDTIEGCNWVSSGGGGGGYGNNDHDENYEQNNDYNNRGYCDGGIVEIDEFCIDIPCSELDQTNCGIINECQWLNSNTQVDCINLPESYCNESNECNWINSSDSSYYGSSGHCSGNTTWIENNSCSDFIVPGCMINIATNFNPNANIDDGSCIFPPLGALSFEELDVWTGTLEIHLDCEYPVSEFSIDISGLNMTGCYGGASDIAGFDIQIDNNNIIGISTGEYIPEHSGLLMILTFDDILNENICYENSWITTSANIQYEAILGECAYVDFGCTNMYSLSYEDSAEYDDGTCIYADNIIQTGMFYFSPSEISIDIGESVQWNNLEGFHSVNGIENTLNNEDFNNPEDFYFSGSNLGLIGSHTFNIPGLYQYDCDINNHASLGMQGTIIVGQGGCIDNTACNYNEEYDFQYGECTFSEENFNCNGECLLEFDNCGICGGLGSTGDINENGIIDISDITYIIEYIIGNISLSDSTICIADINMNGILNITDVIFIIELILSN